jgi:hypothetical protein
MFDWLDQEIKTIKTRRFHVVDGPADPVLRAAVESSEAPIPASYKEFVLRFGNATLYRKLSYYLIGVLASPRVETHKKRGELYYRIGHYDGSDAWFKASDLSGGNEAPVYQSGGGQIRRVADAFEPWLQRKCKAARATFKKQEWANILAGPAPFTPQESKIVEARLEAPLDRFSFRWQSPSLALQARTV